MLYHEIYGKYYGCVARILHAARETDLSRQQVYALVEKHAFAESGMVIPDALRTGRWALMEDGCSVLEHPPEMPLTTLQKRWLKMLLRDPRIRLFAPPETGLEDVEPLYDPSVFVWFDRYSDADPYEDPGYVRNFRLILQAIRENRQVKLLYANQRGRERELVFSPCRLEYSEKDDKFRALARSEGREIIINIARIRSCCLLGDAVQVETAPKPHMGRLVLEISDWRNGLERAMLHFSHLEKTAEKLDEKHYRMTLHYDLQDDTEMLIRVLSFGPLAKVVEPESFRERIRARLEKQKKLQTQL